MRYILVPFIAALSSVWVNLSTAQTAITDNKVSQTITFRPIPKGPSVFGIFAGRSPCQGIAKQLKLLTDADCVKLKWGLVLYHDSISLQPTTCILTIVGGGDVVTQQGGSYRQKILEGKWTIVKGIPSDPAAVVYRLELLNSGPYFYLFKGDENVLFVLDENKEFRIGNEDFSYTLNRIELLPGNK